MTIWYKIISQKSQKQCFHLHFLNTLLHKIDAYFFNESIN